MNVIFGVLVDYDFLASLFTENGPNTQNPNQLSVFGRKQSITLDVVTLPHHCKWLYRQLLLLLLFFLIN